MLQTLAPRVRSQCQSLLERGWFAHAKEELKAGRNPASKGWKRVFCDMLLAGGCSRSDLRMAFMQSCAMKDASAAVQVSNAVSIFSAGRLIREHLSTITVSHN